MAISRPSQRQKVLCWEGTHDSTQYSQVNAGSSSCVQLTPVYSRESWLSLHTPLAILTTSPATTVGTQVLRPHLNTQRQMPKFCHLNFTRSCLLCVLNQVTSPSSGERHDHNKLNKPVITDMLFSFEDTKKPQGSTQTSRTMCALKKLGCKNTKVAKHKPKKLQWRKP